MAPASATEPPRMTHDEAAATAAVPGTAAGSSAAAHHAVARQAMIDSQLRVSGINEHFVLDAMGRVPRENYVAPGQRAVAYVDRQLPLGGDRWLSPPLAHAWLLTEARPARSDRALLIAGGTGYFAALLEPLVASLDVVEAETRLPESGLRVGDWHEGPLTGGWSENAPYDLIVIDGAIEQLPEAIAAQLAENGRIVAGRVERGVTRMAVGRRAGDSVGWLPLADIAIPVLDEFAPPRRWSF